MSAVVTGRSALGADLPAARPVALLPFLLKQRVHHLVGQLASGLGVVGACGVTRGIARGKDRVALGALQGGRSGHEESAATLVGLGQLTSQLADRAVSGQDLFKGRKKKKVYIIIGCILFANILWVFGGGGFFLFIAEI